MKRKIAAAALAVLAIVFVWQAFAQTETPCEAACNAKFDACMKETGGEPILKLRCLTLRNNCLEECR